MGSTASALPPEAAAELVDAALVGTEPLLVVDEAAEGVAVLVDVAAEMGAVLLLLLVVVVVDVAAIELVAAVVAVVVVLRLADSADGVVVGNGNCASSIAIS